MLFKSFVKNKDVTNNDGSLERLLSLQNNLSKLKLQNNNILQKLPRNYLTLILAQKPTGLSAGLKDF